MAEGRVIHFNSFFPGSDYGMRQWEVDFSRTRGSVKWNSAVENFARDYGAANSSREGEGEREGLVLTRLISINLPGERAYATQGTS
jgi:hypothetical protein